MLDRLPAAARHALVLLLVAPLVALLGVYTLAVLTAGGILDLAWSDTTRAAVDAAGVSEATGIATFVALYATPLTRQYGVGSAESGYTRTVLYCTGFV